MQKIKDQKTIFAFLLILLNVVGAIFIDLIFLGAPKPGTPEFQIFIGGLAYTLIIGLVFSFLSTFLKRRYKNIIHADNYFLKHLFWSEMLFFLATYILPYLYFKYIILN